MTTSAALTVLRDGAAVVLIADLQPGQVAFVDGDAVDHAAGPVDAIVLEDDEDAPRWAAHAFATVVDEVVRSLGKPAGPVEVAGNGLLARLIRTSLGPMAASRPGAEPPAVIVDTSGSPERIVDALKRLDELGTLVLAGQARGSDLRLNLYPDLHRRSLTVVGVPTPALAGSPPDDWRPPDWTQAELRRIPVGARVAPGASWYLVEPGRDPDR